jgi:hypothetical protein
MCFFPACRANNAIPSSLESQQSNTNQMPIHLQFMCLNMNHSSTIKHTRWQCKYCIFN